MTSPSSSLAVLLVLLLGTACSDPQCPPGAGKVKDVCFAFNGMDAEVDEDAEADAKADAEPERDARPTCPAA